MILQAGEQQSATGRKASQTVGTENA